VTPAEFNCLVNVVTNAVLPMPDSPNTTRRRLPPLRVSSNVRLSSSSSLSRPIKVAAEIVPSRVITGLVVYSSSELQSRWAAFEAPLPELMPGYQQGQPGNALLVLICYRESSVLVTLPPVEASIAERRELAAAVNRHHGATDAAPS
jgi:hypothetical protein